MRLYGVRLRFCFAFVSPPAPAWKLLIFIVFLRIPTDMHSFQSSPSDSYGFVWRCVCFSMNLRSCGYAFLLARRRPD